MTRDCHPECEVSTAKQVGVLLLAIGMGVLCGYVAGTKDLANATRNDPPQKVRAKR